VRLTEARPITGGLLFQMALPGTRDSDARDGTTGDGDARVSRGPRRSGGRHIRTRQQ
jgi:hypothetical protein